MPFGRMGDAAVQQPGVAQQVTNDLLNVGVSLVQAQTAKKISDQQAQAARDASKAAISQANALSTTAQAQAQAAAIQAESTKRKWMWIIGGGIALIVVGGIVYYFIRKRS